MVLVAPRNFSKEALSTLQVTEFQIPNFRFFQRFEPMANLLSTLKSLEISMLKPVFGITPTTANA